MVGTFTEVTHRISPQWAISASFVAGSFEREPRKSGLRQTEPLILSRPFSRRIAQIGNADAGGSRPFTAALTGPGAMKAIERRRSSIQKSYSTVFALVVCAASFHKRLKLILSGIGHSDVAKVLNRTSDTSAVVKVVLAHKCSTAEAHHDS
jgi:hypothetical protein